MTPRQLQEARQLVGSGTQEARSSVPNRTSSVLQEAVRLERAGSQRKTMLKILAHELRRRGCEVPS